MTKKIPEAQRNIFQIVCIDGTWDVGKKGCDLPPEDIFQDVTITGLL